MTPHDDGTQKAPGRTCPTAYGYRAADLAVCRAGALTVAELAVMGLPAIFWLSDRTPRACRWLTGCSRTLRMMRSFAPFS